MNETIDSVLTYWFGTKQSIAEINNDRKSVWWGKSDQVDEEISIRFKELVGAVASGGLEHWRESAKGLLASIICIDQFPRNIYRGNSKSFVYDPVALELAKQAVATGFDAELSAIQRVFAYLPFEHSEDREMQVQSLTLFETLRDSVAEEDRELFSGFYDYARRHFDVIDRFGRFPHRNLILGRSSTEEEIEFLQQPGSSF